MTIATRYIQIILFVSFYFEGNLTCPSRDENGHEVAPGQAVKDEAVAGRVSGLELGALLPDGSN